jgi:protein O-GlcNAc transferase
MTHRHETLLQARATLSRGQAEGAARLCAKLLIADPRDVEASHLQGRCLAALGRWTDAIAVFRRVLSVQPLFYPALVDLGVALASAGAYPESRKLLEDARALDERPAELHFGLGLCGLGLGDLPAAEVAFRNALSRNARFPDAYNNLGVVYDRLGRLPEAMECFSQAVLVRPNFAMAQTNLGDALLRLGQPAAAAGAFRKAAELSPADGSVHADLGAALLAANDFAAAAEALRRALGLNPRLASAAGNLGEALRNLGAPHDAAVAFGQALALKPNMAEAHLGLGRIAVSQGRTEDALHSLRAAAAFERGVPSTALKIAGLLESLGQYTEAIACAERALLLQPRDAATIALLASCALRICDWALAARSMAQLRETPQGIDHLHPFLTLAADLEPFESAQSLQRRGRAISRPAAAAAGRHAHDRLRLAYLSPDYRNHPVAHALAGVIERHDRQCVTPIAISLTPPDHSEIAGRLKSSFDEFIDASSLSDAAVADLMRQREVDVAIDLAGYTVGARPAIFAFRAATVQVNYLGFPGTTGVDFMDFIIADDRVLPESDEFLYTERVLRMPHCYLPFDCGRSTADVSITRAAAGLPQEGFVFCAFSNGYKIARAMFEIWMSLLRDIPGSVLWLRSMGPAAAANLRASAAALGIAPERLVFAPYVDRMEAHLGRLRLADVFLDTRPYNAHTTAAEALWVGVPVVTCPDRRFAGRVGASVLGAAGLSELIRADLEGYAALALEMAESPDFLRRIREKIALCKTSAPLFDTLRYTRDLESLLFNAWRETA